MTICSNLSRFTVFNLKITFTKHNFNIRNNNFISQGKWLLTCQFLLNYNVFQMMNHMISFLYCDDVKCCSHVVGCFSFKLPHLHCSLESREWVTPRRNVSICPVKQSFMRHSAIAHWTNWYGANKRKSYTNTLTRTHWASRQCTGLLLCSSAICLSAVGPCYLLYPFLARSFTNPLSVPAAPFTILLSREFSKKMSHRKRDPSVLEKGSMSALKLLGISS